VYFTRMCISHYSFVFILLVPVNGHVEMKNSLTPPLITHTAATPMPVPKLPVGGDPILGYESRRGSNVSIDPACYDKSPVSIFIIHLDCNQTCAKLCQDVTELSLQFSVCPPGICPTPTWLSQESLYELIVCVPLLCFDRCD